MEPGNDKKKRSIIQMYREGKYAYEIAREHEIPLIKFYEIIDQAEKEKELLKQIGNAKQQRESKAQEMAASGMDRAEIADRLNVHVNTVKKYLSDDEKDYHFLRSDLSETTPEPNEREKKNLDLIRNSFERGDTQNSLARKTGISIVTMNKLFKKFRLAEEFGMDEAYIRKALSEAAKKGKETAAKERAKKKAKNKNKAMKLIAEGVPVDEVATMLDMSVATIKRYIKEEYNGNKDYK